MDKEGILEEGERVASNIEITVWKGHRQKTAVLCLDIMRVNDRTFLASSGEDGTVRLWDMSTGRAIRCYRGMFGDDPVTALAFLNNIRLFVACGTNLVELAVSSHQIVVTEAADVLSSVTTDEINQISVHPKTRRYLALADDSGCVTILDASLSPAKKIKVLRRQEEDFCTSVLFRPRVNWDLAAGYHQQCSVGLWDFSRARQRVIDVTSTSSGHYQEEEGGRSRLFNPPYVTSLSFSEDGRYLATARGDGTIVIYDYASGTQVALLEDGHGSAVGAVHFVAGGGGLLISGSNDRTLCLWHFSSSPGGSNSSVSPTRLLARVTDLPGKPNWITSAAEPGTSPSEILSRVFVATTSELISVIDVPTGITRIGDEQGVCMCGMAELVHCWNAAFAPPSLPDHRSDP